MDLLTVGEAFEDVVFTGLPRLPRLGEELRVSAVSTHPGGGAIITAIAARRLGVSTGTMTAVSDANVRALRRERVALLNLRRAHEPGAITVALSTSGDRAFVTYEGVNRRLEARLLTAIRNMRRVPRHVHLALVPRRCRAWVPVVHALHERGATTSWDFGWHEGLIGDGGFRPLLAAVDWIFVNDREAKLYTGSSTLRQAIARWQQMTRGTVIKRGPDGAVVLAEGGELRVATSPRPAVDTTGAGDSFNGGFLVAWLAGASLTAAARLGNHVGGRSVTAAGGVDGLPHRERLPAWARRLLETP